MCIVVLAVIFSIACNTASEQHLNIYSSIDSSFEVTHGEMQRNINRVFRELEQKMTDPAVSEKATLWYKKASAVRDQYTNAFKHLAKLKENVSKSSNGGTSLSTHETSSIREILVACRDKTFSVDSSILQNIGSLPLEKHMDDLSFDNLHKIAVIARLSQVQADLKSSENMVIEYCSRNVPSGDDSYTHYQFLIHGLNSRYYPGEKAEIFAGLGSYSSMLKPSIMINNKQAERTTAGDYLYAFRVGDKPGRYSVPIHITYSEPYTGKSATISKTLTYTVERKCPD